MIEYRCNFKPDAALIVELYRAAELVRPVEDSERIATMYAGSNIVLSAWDGERLVGILRGWTDGAFDGYVCDLAVHPDYQNAKIGRTLLDQARASAGPAVQFVLRASILARHYYSHIGWQKIKNGWFSPRGT